VQLYIVIGSRRGSISLGSSLLVGSRELGCGFENLCAAVGIERDALLDDGIEGRSLLC